ncbi:unnamed protein product [Ixodes hexagonus]
MSQDRAMMRAMTFSPPSKRDDTAVKTVAAPTEVLLLQPFSRPPQLCFEDIPVGTEASRLLKVCNASGIVQTVFIERVPVDKGFAVDAQVFKVAPRGHQILNVTWKPTDNAASCRVTVNVRSDQGYKGGLVLLATVKKSVTRASRQAVKSRTKVLAQSQQLNVLPSAKKAAPALTHTKKRNVTIPVEFTLQTETLRGSRTKAASAQLAINPTSVRKFQETPKASDKDLDPVRRETFVCTTTLDAVSAATAATTEEFNDSLDGEYASAVDNEVRNSTFTPPSSPQDGGKGTACREDTFDSGLDFSARMEEFYEKILQGLDRNRDPMESPSHHDFSVRMQKRYEKVMSECQSPTRPSVKAGRKECKENVQDPKLSTPMLPDIADVVAQLDQNLDLGGDANDSITSSLRDIIRKYTDDGEPLGLEEFFPADVSSIYGSPVAL